MKILGDRAKLNESLANHTFLKIGGLADIFYEAETTEEFKKAVIEARKLNIPITILGDGSNVLISDEGIRGLVLIDRSDKIEILGERTEKIELQTFKKPVYRWESDDKVGTFKYEFKDLDYDASENPRVRVKMDSGVNLPKATDFLLEKGITGFQWYAGIPGTIGGAIFNNIHGGTHFISEVVDTVTVLDLQGGIHTLNIEDLGVDYDKSRFQETGEIILDATFLLYKGDVEKAKYVRYELAKRKSLQPRNAPGCAFHNLTQGQKEKLGIPTTSIGFVIEHLLKMTGFKIGDATISKDHHNFIVNEGKATAKDYLAVMKIIYKKAKKELGIELVPEVFLLGFEEKEIKEFRHPRQIELRKKRLYEIRTVYKDSKKIFPIPGIFMRKHEYKGKKVAVLGFGLEGKDAVGFLQKKGAHVTVYDKKPKNELDLTGVKSRKVEFVCGDNYIVRGLIEYDAIVRSPGVYRYLPEIIDAENKGVGITSAVKLFFDLCPSKIIGVTGTKGKGTTATLIYQILKKAKKDVHLAGNIGAPMLKLLPKLKPESWVVLELSSFQLIDMTQSPHIAVVLNITEDHMDWHKDRKEYIDAKKNIVNYQERCDYAVLNYDYSCSKSFSRLSCAKEYYFSKKKRVSGCYVEKGKIILKIDNAGCKIGG